VEYKLKLRKRNPAILPDTLFSTVSLIYPWNGPAELPGQNCRIDFYRPMLSSSPAILPERHKANSVDPAPDGKVSFVFIS